MKITIRDMIEIAMFVAIAIIFDMPFLKIRIGSNGGSISLTMVPLFILAYRRGPLKALIGCGIIYGVITCLTDGWGFACYPFDYLIGYGSIAIAGFFGKLVLENKKKPMGIVWIVVSVLVACFGRMIGSTLSSVILWEYKFIPALIYNVTYIGPSCIATIVALILLYPPLLEVNKRNASKSIW